MRYQIDSDILNKTTKCNNYFSCLHGNKDCLCEVEEIIKINGRIVIIDPLKNRFCEKKFIENMIRDS
jgi:hypothetical protein